MYDIDNNIAPSKIKNVFKYTANIHVYNTTSSADPFPGKFAGGANLRGILRNVKRKTKGLQYNLSKIGNMCRKSGIQKNPFEISSIISLN
jgi:hypothetical protein